MSRHQIISDMIAGSKLLCSKCYVNHFFCRSFLDSFPSMASQISIFYVLLENTISCTLHDRAKRVVLPLYLKSSNSAIQSSPSLVVSMSSHNTFFMGSTTLFSVTFFQSTPRSLFSLCIVWLFQLDEKTTRLVIVYNATLTLDFIILRLNHLTVLHIWEILAFPFITFLHCDLRFLGLVFLIFSS